MTVRFSAVNVEGWEMWEFKVDNGNDNLEM